MLVFAHPWLLALLPLALLVHLLVPAYQQRRSALRVPDLERLARIAGQTPLEGGAVVARRSRSEWGALWIVWLAVVVAWARPQWIEEPVTRSMPMRDLLLAVDLSGSMEAPDFTNPSGARIDRLTAVQQVLDEFLTRREGDRVGLLVFGSAAFVQSPFTEDLDVVRTLLAETQVRMAGPRTVVGDAIGLALSVFEHSQVEQRVLILLTDGNDTDSLVPPVRAAEIARDHEIVIHTVAIGDPAAVGEEQLDMHTLAQIAETTGGRSFFGADRDQLEQIYAELDELNPRQVETVSQRPQRDLFHWPLGAGVAVSLLQAGAAIARRRRGRGRREAPVVEEAA